MVLFWASVVTCIVTGTTRANVMAACMCIITVLVLFMTKWLSDGSRRGIEVLKSFFTRSHVICPKSDKDIKKALNDKTALHLCPTGLVKSEVHNVIGNIRPGETYRAVTHERMVNLIETRRKTVKTDKGENTL